MKNTPNKQFILLLRRLRLNRNNNIWFLITAAPFSPSRGSNLEKTFQQRLQHRRLLSRSGQSPRVPRSSRKMKVLLCSPSIWNENLARASRAKPVGSRTCWESFMSLFSSHFSVRDATTNFPNICPERCSQCNLINSVYQRDVTCLCYWSWGQKRRRERESTKATDN